MSSQEESTQIQLQLQVLWLSTYQLPDYTNHRLRQIKKSDRRRTVAAEIHFVSQDLIPSCRSQEETKIVGRSYRLLISQVVCRLQ